VKSASRQSWSSKVSGDDRHPSRRLTFDPLLSYHTLAMRRYWHSNMSGQWKPALLHAVPISMFNLGLFYYWFGVADRYVIFLYGHLNATPFDEVTSGRYWMSGLVASGAVMVLYTSANWLLGRIAASRHLDYRPPAWWQVWALCVIPLVIGIPAITMTLNWPTLPPANATACVLATLVGLALALTPGSWAAQRPSDLGWLIFDGMGLMPALSLLRAVELPARGLVSAPIAFLAALAATFAGMVWLVVMTGSRKWRHKSWPETRALFVAGLCLSYLLMPLVHHLLVTPPGYRYISTSSNFFASNIGLQLLVLLVAALLAITITRVRRRLP
jgi:hypothetical protein